MHGQLTETLSYGVVLLCKAQGTLMSHRGLPEKVSLRLGRGGIGRAESNDAETDSGRPSGRVGCKAVTR